MEKYLTSLFDYCDEMMENYEKYYFKKTLIREADRLEQISYNEYMKMYANIQTFGIGKAIAILGLNRDLLEKGKHKSLTFPEEALYDEGNMHLKDMLDYYNQQNTSETKFAGMDIITNSIGKTSGRDFMTLLRNAIMHGKVSIVNGESEVYLPKLKVKYQPENVCNFEADISSEMFYQLIDTFYGQNVNYAVLNEDVIRVMGKLRFKTAVKEEDLKEILENAAIHEYDIEYKNDHNEFKKDYRVVETEGNVIIEGAKISNGRSYKLFDHEIYSMLNIIKNYYPEFYVENAKDQEDIFGQIASLIINKEKTMTNILSSLRCIESFNMEAPRDPSAAVKKYLPVFREDRYMLHLFKPMLMLTKLYNLVSFVITNPAIDINYNKLQINGKLSMSKKIDDDEYVKEVIACIRNSLAHGNVEFEYGDHGKEDIYFIFKNIHKEELKGFFVTRQDDLNAFINHEEFKEKISNTNNKETEVKSRK